MSCGCAYVDVDDYCTVLEQKVVRAQKKHNCYVCGRKIVSGEKYERVKGVQDGDFLTNKTCIDCLSIRDEFFCGEYHYEFMEDLQYHLDDIQGQVKSECLEALTPAARDRVIDMIDETWERIDRRNYYMKKMG